MWLNGKFTELTTARRWIFHGLKRRAWTVPKLPGFIHAVSPWLWWRGRGGHAWPHKARRKLWRVLARALYCSEGGSCLNPRAQGTRRRRLTAITGIQATDTGEGGFRDPHGRRGILTLKERSKLYGHRFQSDYTVQLYNNWRKLCHRTDYNTMGPVVQKMIRLNLD